MIIQKTSNNDNDKDNDYIFIYFKYIYILIKNSMHYLRHELIVMYWYHSP